MLRHPTSLACSVHSRAIMLSLRTFARALPKALPRPMVTRVPARDFSALYRPTTTRPALFRIGAISTSRAAFSSAVAMMQETSEGSSLCILSFTQPEADTTSGPRALCHARLGVAARARKHRIGRSSSGAAGVPEHERVRGGSRETSGEDLADSQHRSWTHRVTRMWC